MDPTFDELTPAERIQYLQELWDRIAADPEALPLTDPQRAEVRRRVAEHRADPSTAIPWEQILRRS